MALQSKNSLELSIRYHAYIKIFEHLKDVRFHFLEIGIFQGRSLAMWSDYFKNATINGIDINTKEFYLTKPELEKMSAFTNNNLGLIEQIDTTQMDLNRRKEWKRPRYADSAWKLLDISPPIDSKVSKIRSASASISVPVS